MIDLELERERAYTDREVEVSAEQVLEDLVSCSADTLEGLAVNIHTDVHTRQAEHGLRLLDRALPRLPDLTQLSVKLMVDEVKPIAERLALACPSLRFVSTERKYYRVWRDAGRGTVALEEMRRMEVQCVELWRHSVLLSTVAYVPRFDIDRRKI